MAATGAKLARFLEATQYRGRMWQYLYPAMGELPGPRVCCSLPKETECTPGSLQPKVSAALLALVVQPCWHHGLPAPAPPPTTGICMSWIGALRLAQGGPSAEEQDQVWRGMHQPTGCAATSLAAHPRPGRRPRPCQLLTPAAPAPLLPCANAQPGLSQAS